MLDLLFLGCLLLFFVGTLGFLHSCEALMEG